MDKKRTKINIISYIFMCVTLVGSIGVGLTLALSEVVYPSIESFFLCPLWYQIFSWTSLTISICGVFGCVFFKDKNNSKKKHLYISIGIGFVSLILNIITLLNEQSTVRDVFFVFSSLLLSVSFFMYWCIIIGLYRKPFEQTIVERIIKSGVTDDNVWNCFIQDQQAFNYDNAFFPQKLSYLTYQLYSNTASGSGFEGFFNIVEVEPFSKNNIIKILFRDKFFSEKLKNLLSDVLNNYKKDNREELNEHWEKYESRYLFEFEQELFNCCVWLSYNQCLLEPDTVQNAIKNIEKLYVSKNYMKRVIIIKYKNLYTYTIEDWIFDSDDVFSGNWYGIGCSLSLYDSVENVVNDIKYILNDYIEIK